MNAAAWWTGLKGFVRYRSALASGNIVTPQRAIEKLRVCSLCREPRRYQAKISRQWYWTCGPKFEEAPGRFCGCVIGVDAGPDAGEGETVTLTIDGRARQVAPAAKLMVADGADGVCPRGLFGESPRDPERTLWTRIFGGIAPRACQPKRRATSAARWPSR